MATKSEAAVAAIRNLETCLLKLSEKTGELRLETRRLMILGVLLQNVSGAKCLDDLLALVSEILGFIENWTDCANRNLGGLSEADQLGVTVHTLEKLERNKEICLDRSRGIIDFMKDQARSVRDVEEKKEDEFITDFLEPARKAVYKVENTLCALVDEAMKDRDTQ